MTSQHYQAIFASVWVLTTGTVAVVTGVTSLPALAVFGVVALLPPVIMQVLWRDPPQSISESIRDARR